MDEYAFWLKPNAHDREREWQSPRRVRNLGVGLLCALVSVVLEPFSNPFALDFLEVLFIAVWILCGQAIEFVHSSCSVRSLVGV